MSPGVALSEMLVTGGIGDSKLSDKDTTWLAVGPRAYCPLDRNLSNDFRRDLKTLFDFIPAVDKDMMEVKTTRGF